jgi:hypothetical protein
MMTFVDMDRPDTPIRTGPGHSADAPARLRSAIFFGAQFQAEARKFFNVEEVDAGIDAARATAILQNAGHAGTALLAVTAERAFLLHTPKAIGTALFGKLSLRQQALDVVQLHKCLLEGVLKISEEAIRNQENVSYCREAAEALSQVRSGKAQGVPDESGAHGAGSRYRLCRRGAAPEVHRFLSQVAERPHDLCAGVAKYPVPSSVPSVQLSKQKVRHWALRTGYWPYCWPLRRFCPHCQRRRLRAPCR